MSFHCFDLDAVLWDVLPAGRQLGGASANYAALAARVQDMTMNQEFYPNRALFRNPKVNPNSAEALGQYNCPRPFIAPAPAFAPTRYLTTSLPHPIAGASFGQDHG